MRNQTALITGASGGIGYEFAKLLAQDCNTLVLVARNGDRLAEVKKELETGTSVSVLVVEKDLAKPGAADELYRELRIKNIGVDILVNNAGFGDNGAFSETDWALEEKMIAVNIIALTQMTKLFVKGMVERKSGRVLNVASTAAFQPGPFMAVYYASKAYVLSFSEAIASELKGTGVTVTVLCPGPTGTGFATTARMEHSRLFNLVKPASAADVARFGYQAMQSGSMVAIHGALNKIMAFSTRMAPRKLLLLVTRLLNEKAR
ncbi:MAG TPA: SDR family oxidoreductase [Nitrospirota bacterium]|nr:SDR family oxidoreductase [Nitrospirota bacterium]